MYPAAVVVFWYIALAVLLVAGIALGVRRALFVPAGEAPLGDGAADETPAPSEGATPMARMFGWFGVGDIEEDLALAATLCTGGAVGLALHAIAHAALRVYPGWFGLLALTTGLMTGIGMARVLSRAARGGW